MRLAPVGVGGVTSPQSEDSSRIRTAAVGSGTWPLPDVEHALSVAGAGTTGDAQGAH